MARLKNLHDRFLPLARLYSHMELGSPEAYLSETNKCWVSRLER